MLFLQSAVHRDGGGFSKNLSVQMCSRQQSTGYLAQDCQRRHSQASRAPVWLTVCFLIKNMSDGSVCFVVVHTNRRCCVEQRAYYTIRIRLVYSPPMIVPIRYRQHKAARRPRRFGVVGGVAN